jgi:CHAT domain-containing protein
MRAAPAASTQARPYRELVFKKQMTTDGAIADAHVTILRDRWRRGDSTHPFFWAAFVAAGSWR